MRIASKAIRRLRPAAPLTLALIAIVGALFFIDQQGAGLAAGRWTVTRVTEAREGPRLPVKVGDPIIITPDGFVRLPEWDGRFGVLGRAPCGSKCFVISGLVTVGHYQVVLDDDLRTLTVTSAGGYMAVAERSQTQ